MLKNVIGGLSLIWAGLAMGTTQQIGETALDSDAFNPSRGELVTFSYRLEKPDHVRVRVYDPDGGLVRELVSGAELGAGNHKVEWDGRDMESLIVPNEAYTFTVETATGAVYDPTVSSGGIVRDITEANFKEEGTVTYRLPVPARVLVRLGIHNGPMLKTLVDWKPRTAGTVTEYWDGKDEDDLIELRQVKGFNSLITYVTLPESTVITYGNNTETYRQYKLGRAAGRPAKPKRPRQQENSEIQLIPQLLVPPAWARAPQLKMRLSPSALGNTGTDKSDGQLFAVGDSVQVRIDVDPQDREMLEKQQFEIIFFVDNIFFAEAERGYLPLNWNWELQTIPAGEHVLTVNVSSFRGQVGVTSQKILRVLDN